eukprot:TRINITY_DN16447_c0_g1_i7.p1 TRINITY_DN16447_c0_g1~~TRINITY_DN16447_c0_g1_i7.p1  ORF type:complete len:167 (+),score=57.51 TRINITY_DN16447_c0_g1_i7:263-763(+)
MQNLKSLSLSRNLLKRLDYLDSIADRLEQLWISYNPGINSFAGVESCTKLRVLFAGNCNISNMREISRLQVLPALEELVIHGNPLQVRSEKEEGPLVLQEKILDMLPSLRRLDGIAAIQWRTKMAEGLSLIHISEPTRLLSISYAVFCLKKKKKNLPLLMTSIQHH